MHSLSKTRWSARIDAVRPLVKNHKKMLEALSKLQTELDLTAEAYSDSECLLMWMNSFEYILMATFWFKTLQCIDDVNKILQFADISIAEEAKYLGSLHQDVQTLRDSWENLLEEAKLVSSALDQHCKRNVPERQRGEIQMKQKSMFIPLKKKRLKLTFSTKH